MLPMITRFNDQNWFPTLFSDFFTDDVWSTTRKLSVTAPAVNVIDEEKEYKVEVAAPGMTKEDFRIEVNADGNLVINLEKKAQQADDAKGEGKPEVKVTARQHKYLRREFSYEKYQQAFTLPDDADKDKISAHMADGVLTIDIPKLAPEPVVNTSRRIEIH